MDKEVTKAKSKPVSFSVPESEYDSIRATAEECETDVAGINKALFQDAITQAGSLRAAYAAALARRASALAGSSQGHS